MVRRWMTFNVVGAAGVIVQLTVLAVLVRLFDVHYLPATALAVEAALLHNFAWHHGWTWRDRPPASRRAAWGRLGRFHLLNGAISGVGNLALMALLAGGLGMDPLLANAIAIVACSCLNFAASESLVFPPGMAMVAAALVAGSPAHAEAQGASALSAWNAHQATVDARYHAATPTGSVFFVQDLPGGSADWRTRVLGGAIAAQRLTAPGAGDGRIHHWAGAVFVPRTTVAQVIERLQQQAGRESELYEDVIASRLLSRSGNRLHVYMKLRRTTIITATFHTEHAVEYRHLGEGRGSSRSVSTRIAELADAGTPRERERAAGEDRGFLWRLNAYWRFEGVNGGVIVECESVSLSRGVPALLRPVAGPMIDGVARESLERTLRALGASLAAPALSAGGRS